MQRRRFLTIAAGAACAAGLPAPRAAALTQWRGVALGAEATITLDHPQADRLIARARAEIDRLEAVFSLYRPGSALSRLNADGVLEAPPFELLECLSVAGRVHETSGGAFDPTIQPLWSLYAEHAARGGADLPPAAARSAVLARTGWDRVEIDAGAIRLPQGAALSLNGIAQGYISDRVAGLLRAEGLEDVLVDTGEMRALGGDPRGGPWDVALREGNRLLPERVALANAALATSAPRGTAFDVRGQIGHILDPATGLPAAGRWRLVSVVAPEAVVADALSTTFVLMSRAEIDATLAHWPQARIARLVPVGQGSLSEGLLPY
jgi:thiamine biosynthesis lipoprotein